MCARSRSWVRRPRARARSALALARRFGGEIVACDSTAVYRGIDIGTDKVAGGRAAAAFRIIWWTSRTRARPIRPRATRADAAAAMRGIHRARPAADPRRRHGLLLSRARARPVSRARRATTALRARLDRVADRRGVERCIAGWRAWIPASARRIQPRDRKRHGARARGVSADRAAADRALRRHRVADCRRTRC